MEKLPGVPSGHEHKFLGGSRCRFRSPKLTRASGASPGTCRLQRFLGVGGSGRSPLESADPQVRRAGRRGETDRRKLWFERLGKGFRGLGAAEGNWPQELNWDPQIFEELSAIINTCASELSEAPSSSPGRYFRSPGKHSEHVLTPILDPGKVVPA